MSTEDISISREAQQLAEQEADNENTIKEEYKLWRQNCRYMYEFVSETALKWPSITIDWLPQREENVAEGLIEAKLLLGTHTSGEETNYLKIASTQVPLGPSLKVNSRIKITKKFENDFEINRARHMPQDPKVAGTINGGGEIDIYKLDGDDKLSIHHLTYHTENGYGISWNKFKKGYLATGSDDKTVVVTEVLEKAVPVVTIAQHSDIVNDVEWHHFDENVLASVSDDNYTNIYDIRQGDKPAQRFWNKDAKGVNAISFSPFSRNLLAIGNANSNINLLDLRKISSSLESNSGLLHTMMAHSDAITCLQFSPHRDGIIASGSQDRRLMVWDLARIGEEQAQEDAEDGCPELFMMHAGHTGGVTDLSWCPYKDWTIGSVADDNIVHLWEVSLSLLNAEVAEDVEPGELE